MKQPHGFLSGRDGVRTQKRLLRFRNLFKVAYSFLKRLPHPSLFFCFVFFVSILFVLSSRSERLEQATKRLPALSELDQLLEYNASKNRFLWNERNGQRIRLQNFIENRTIAVNKDQEDDDAIELINCVYKFTMCRLQDTIRDPGFLL